MRFIAIIAAFLAIRARAETPAAKLWDELKAKRDALAGLHEEFVASRTATLQSETRNSTWQIVLDMSQGRWREKSADGIGDHLRIFDGTDVFWMEEAGQEFVRVKRRPKEGDPLPSPYLNVDAEWSKIVEVERRPCKPSDPGRLCVLLDVPLKAWTRTTGASRTVTMAGGAARILADLETGIVLSLHTLEGFQEPGRSHRVEITYSVKQLSYGAQPDAALFRLPPDKQHEVRELPRWDAGRIKKQLAGKAAPELNATDLEGKPVSLASFKGKTVLLDFWTTWCPPCRADAPALDKLYRKYGERDLMIIGVAVGEARAIVEKFLKDHPHAFPVVLTSENEMSMAYQINVLPTYVVIERDGTVVSAVQGDQGFGELRKLLKKAGLEVD